MKLAVIGDIHGFWDEHDTAFFNGSDYDALLLVGDFAGWTGSLPVARMLAGLTRPAWAIPGNHDAVTRPQLSAFNGSDYDALLLVGDFAGWTGSLPVARMLAGLTRPAWAIPGNHDAVTRPQLSAEIANRAWLCALTSIGMTHRVCELAKTMAPVRLGGYSLDLLEDGLGLLTARPHAMGPDRFHYRGYLRRHFGIADFEQSGERLKALVDQAPRRLIMLAHNGPSGLGDTPDAPFGNDFKPSGGDFGDPDLRAAFEHARATGRRVLAVVAGHMHHYNRKTHTTQRTCARDGDTLCINAARVPRIRRDGSHRHHIALQVDGDTLRAETLFVGNSREIEAREPLIPTT